MSRTLRMSLGLILLLPTIYGVPSSAYEVANTRAVFEERYRAWVQYTETKDKLSGEAGINDGLSSMIEMGPGAVPFLIEKMEKNAYGMDFQLGFAVYQITNKVFTKEKHPEVVDAISLAHAYVKWWRQERDETPRLFAEYYGNYETARKSRDEAKEKEALRCIQDLGVDVLPLLMEKIRNGNDELIPVVNWVTSPHYVESLPALANLKSRSLEVGATREQCLTWWGTNKGKWTLPPTEE